MLRLSWNQPTFPHRTGDVPPSGYRSLAAAFSSTCSPMWLWEHCQGHPLAAWQGQTRAQDSQGCTGAQEDSLCCHVLSMKNSKRDTREGDFPLFAPLWEHSGPVKVEACHGRHQGSCEEQLGAIPAALMGQNCLEGSPHPVPQLLALRSRHHEQNSSATVIKSLNCSSWKRLLRSLSPPINPSCQGHH